MDVLASLDQDDLEASAGEQLAAVKSELASFMEPFDAFSLLANIAISNTPLDANEYRETEFEGLIAGVEFVAALLVERGRFGTDEDFPPIDAVVIDKVNELSRRALRLVSMQRLGALRTALKDEDIAAEAMGGLRYSMVTRELFLRNPAYADQETQTIRGIFDRDQVAEALRELVGFDADQALSIVSRLADRTGEILGSEMVRLRRQSEKVKGIYDEWRSGSDQVPEGLRLLFEAMGRMPDKRAMKALVETGVMGFWAKVGDVLCFTPEQLADETGIPKDAVVAFLDWFSIQFGELDSTDWVAAARTVRFCPLFKDDDTYFLTIPGNLLWAIRPRLEDGLKPAKNPAAEDGHWKRFENARKSYLEANALDLLEEVVRPTWSHRNLEYWHDGLWYETDGLLAIDTSAIVVEAKAGSLTPPSRRAAPKRMQADLGKLLGDGASQAERLQMIVAECDTLKVRRDGVVLEIDVSGIRHVFAVVVTLEDLGPFAIALWELQGAEIIAGHRSLPWAVSLHDLEIICDLVEMPAQLIHYMIRRRTLNTLQRFRASDELDLWMYYLDTGLYEDETFEGPDAPDVVALQSLTDKLDAYYLWRRGVRSKKARKPAQKMHHHFRRMLEHLDSERPRGFIEASVALLNMAGRERRMVAGKLKVLKEDSAKSNRFRDMTVMYTASLGGVEIPYGLTWMTGPPDNLHELEGRLELYCQAKKHQLKAHTWFGFAAVDGDPGPFQYYMYGSFPWEEDYDLDQLIEDMGLLPVDPDEVADS